MPWLKMRLALALAGLPGTALAVSACGPGQTNAPDTKPPIENTTDPTDDTTKPDLPELTADQWCGPPTDAWDRGGTGSSDDPCPDGVSAEGDQWSRDHANGDMRTDAMGETTCCYNRIYNRDHDIVIGRPLLVDGETRTASATPTGAWVPSQLVDSTITDGLAAPVRDEIAQRWLGNALLEHASVASFARATIELMAVGAPPSLISAAQRAASDEIRHAQMCFAIASSYAGGDVGPGPLPAAAPRDLDLAQVAVHTFIEGCVPESIGALVAERLADRARHPEIARILREIAADEARHAELAWSTVGWAVRAGGRPVIDAVLEAARAYAMPPVADASPFDDQLAAHGLMTDAEQGEYLRRGWRELIGPLLDDLVAGKASIVDSTAMPA